MKLCAKLTAKFLTTAYKLKILKFKLDEDPLRRRINFLTLIKSLEMKCLQYNETCEVLLDYPTIGGRKAIRNILHANIDIHSRMFAF